ncbi:hypothetical protein Pelo_9667 [Pelomyxa schiedti]|nr:hypothetical protein Pelo_9667 [Pelomyxa schiedti]
MLFGGVPPVDGGDSQDPPTSRRDVLFEFAATLPHSVAIPTVPARRRSLASKKETLSASSPVTSADSGSIGEFGFRSQSLFKPQPVHSVLQCCGCLSVVGDSGDYISHDPVKKTLQLRRMRCVRPTQPLRSPTAGPLPSTATSRSFPTSPSVDSVPSAALDTTGIESVRFVVECCVCASVLGCVAFSRESGCVGGKGSTGIEEDGTFELNADAVHAYVLGSADQCSRYGGFQLQANVKQEHE